MINAMTEWRLGESPSGVPCDKSVKSRSRQLNQNAQTAAMDQTEPHRVEHRRWRSGRRTTICSTSQALLVGRLQRLDELRESLGIARAAAKFVLRPPFANPRQYS